MPLSQPLISDYFQPSQLTACSLRFVADSVNSIGCDLSAKDVKMYYQNVRGLRTKTSDFANNALSCDYDIIALTETSLNDSFFDSELFNLKRFSVHRTDRSYLNSTHQRFGGVLIAVRASISSDRILVPGTDNVEMVLVRVQLRDHSLYICCLYIPSASSVQVYNEYRDALEKVLNFVDLDLNDEMCVLGDFNLSLVYWIPDSISSHVDGIDDLINGEGESGAPNVLLPSGVGAGAKADVIYLMMSAGLHQINGERNFYGDILDLVFFSNPNGARICRSHEPLSRVDQLTCIIILLKLYSLWTLLSAWNTMIQLANSTSRKVTTPD